MGIYRIALIVAGIRKDSLNHKLAAALVKTAPSEFKFKHVRIDDLPLFNEDDEVDPPLPILRFRGELKSSQAFLFVTPEYNRSIPGVLKNAIDQGSHPRSQNVWALKPAGVLGISAEAAESSAAQQQLRNVLAALNVFVPARPIAAIQAKEGLFDDAGSIDASQVKFLQSWMDEYVAWVKKFVG